MTLLAVLLNLTVALLLLTVRVVESIVEAADGSVCFDNCNGHGTCREYTCYCDVGYHGDDCKTTFVKEGTKIIPILSAGHFNVTAKNFTNAVMKNKLLLVGFSSYECHKCIVAEPEYEKVAIELKQLGVPFARANADQLKSIAMEHKATELPSLVLFQNNRPLPYKGFHSSESIVAYVSKVRGLPATTLSSVEDVQKFLQNRSNFSLSTVMVVGFFSDYDGVEEDDYEEWLQVAKDLQSRENIYFGVVTKPSVAEWFKKNKTIDRTPSMLVYGEDEIPKTINLDELFGSGEGISEWIVSNAAPLVGKLTHSNFQIYEKMNKPMLMMFLDLSHEHNSESPGKIIGGRSGGILNEVLIEELRQVAKEHSDRIIFTYLDGNLFPDQMRSLGLYGGAERLPSLAFNSRDAIQAPFPEELSINKDTMLQFCADFLSGKLRTLKDSEDMAKRALMAVNPLNTRNKAVRKAKKQAPAQVRGVSEQFGDGTAGDMSTVRVTNENFEKIVMAEDKDVVLLLHAKGCESCANFAVYFKKMAQRFRDLNIYSLVIARMDVTDESPPSGLGLMEGALPILVMVPAYAKHPPWTFYSGIGKVQPMMKWVHQQAAIPFDLPLLPHLTPEEREMYKTQIREREEALEQKRVDERREMAKEEAAQKELARKKRKQDKNAASAATANGVSDSASVQEPQISNDQATESPSTLAEKPSSVDFDGVVKERKSDPKTGGSSKKSKSKVAKSKESKTAGKKVKPNDIKTSADAPKQGRGKRRESVREEDNDEF